MAVEENPNILLDALKGIYKKGTFNGSFIMKLKAPSHEIIFADNVVIRDSEIRLKGLHVGIKNGKAYSFEQESSFIGNIQNIEYIIKLNLEIIKEFDALRFSINFPNIIRFLHSSLLYSNLDQNVINHIDFVSGEILNRPVAVCKDGGIILSDVVVFEDAAESLVFHNGIQILRDENQTLQAILDPLTTVSLDKIIYVIILGAENF